MTSSPVPNINETSPHLGTSLHRGCWAPGLMRIVVTGATGNIGTAVTAELLATAEVDLRVRTRSCTWPGSSSRLIDLR